MWGVHVKVSGGCSCREWVWGVGIGFWCGERVSAVGVRSELEACM